MNISEIKKANDQINKGLQILYTEGEKLLNTYWSSNETGKVWKVIVVYRPSKGFRSEITVRLEDQSITHNWLVKCWTNKTHPTVDVGLGEFINKIESGIVNQIINTVPNKINRNRSKV